MCMPSACRDQKNMSDPLRLELQMVVSYSVFNKSNKCS